MVHTSISEHTAAEMSRQQGVQISDLFTIFFNKQMAFFFTTIIFFTFKTSEYNGECDGL